MLAVAGAVRGGAPLRFPVATMGKGGGCKYCKSKLDWCDLAEGEGRRGGREGGRVREQLRVLMNQDRGEVSDALPWVHL